MRLSWSHRVALGLYGLAWGPAVPLLALSSRLREGFWKRTAPESWTGGPGWSDVWVQAASAGEAYLAWELLKHYPESDAEQPSFLLTSTTGQGMGILSQAASWAAEQRPELTVRTTWFPFDMPRYMRRALSLALPKVVVLTETELWPGLLAACAEADVPVVVVNGRMSTKSLAGYLAIKDFFRAVRPQRVVAMSESDGRRFGLLFGGDVVEVAPNMKFDRLAPRTAASPGAAAPRKKKSLRRFLPDGAPFVVLGSVREEEEQDVLSIIQALRTSRPEVCIGLFPRHMHRVEQWSAILDAAGIPWGLRSQLEGPPPAGGVVVWDVFGELGAAYGLADAAFVGGSLRPLGGQNFLEPMAHGVVPVIGPHWANFAWVGCEVLDRNLATETADAHGAAAALLDCLANPEPRDAVRTRYEAFLQPRLGGAATAAAAVRSFL